MRCARSVVLAAATAIAAIALPHVAANAASPVPGVATVGGQPITYTSTYGTAATAYAVRGEDLHYTVDYTGYVAGTYETKVMCNQDPEQISTTVVPDQAPGGVVEYTASTPTQVNGVCQIRIRRTLPEEDYGQPSVYVLVLLVPPSINLSDFKNTSGSSFYPLVPAHPDYWHADFSSNHPAEATMSVRTSTGRLIYKSTRSTVQTIGDRTWEFKFGWAGHNSAGTPVPTGTYKVTFAAHSTLNSTTDSMGPVSAIVKSGRRPITVSATKVGRDSTTSQGGGCAATPQVSRLLWLNCAISHGGSTAFAGATWSFTVPRNAKIAGYKIVAAAAGDDHPTLGSVTRSLTRSSSTKVLIKLRVTNRRSYIVNSVKLVYTYFK